MNTLTKSKLTSLAQTANAAHADFERSIGEALDHAQQAGATLIEVKASLPHGQFEKWLADNVSFSARSARAYMRVAANWSAIAQHRNECPRLSLRDAIDLLAIQREEEPQIGSMLPFCLPPAGQMVLGVIKGGESLLDWTIFVIEAIDEDFIRTAVAGETLYYDKRGWNRIALEKWLELRNFAPGYLESFDWMPPRPATAANNPLRAELPEWRYAA